MTLNPQQLLTFLAASIAARLPILITGAPCDQDREPSRNRGG